MALETASAVETPFPPPDRSSPRRSFANRSFIISTSVQDTKKKQKQQVKSRGMKHITNIVVVKFSYKHTNVVNLACLQTQRSMYHATNHK